MPNRRHGGFSTALGIVLLAACAFADAQASGPAVTDDLGRQLALPAPAQRLLTLAPHATELVFAAGGGERIVGTVDYSDYPPAALALPRVGDAWQLNPETVLALRPDLVVAWQSGPTTMLQPVLQAAGIPVFFSAPAKLVDIPANIEKLGALMGTQDVANAVAQDMRARLARIEAEYASRAAVSVFIQAGSQPLYTLTDKHIVGDALRICGATNVFGSAGPAAPMIDVETVIAANPQVILAATGTGYNDPIADWRRYAPALPAVERGHLFILDADALYRPGPRLIDATEQLCKLIDGVRSTP